MIWKRGSKISAGTHFAGVSVVSHFTLRQLPGQSLVWSIADIEPTILTVFWFRDACCDGHVKALCPDDGMCRNVQVVLVPLVTKAQECVNRIRLSWLLKCSSFNPVCRSLLSRDPLKKNERASPAGYLVSVSVGNWGGNSFVWILQHAVAKMFSSSPRFQHW